MKQEVENSKMLMEILRNLFNSQLRELFEQERENIQAYVESCSLKVTNKNYGKESILIYPSFCIANESKSLTTFYTPDISFDLCLEDLHIRKDKVKKYILKIYETMLDKHKNNMNKFETYIESNIDLIKSCTKDLGLNDNCFKYLPKINKHNLEYIKVLIKIEDNIYMSYDFLPNSNRFNKESYKNISKTIQSHKDKIVKNLSKDDLEVLQGFDSPIIVDSSYKMNETKTFYIIENIDVDTANELNLIEIEIDKDFYKVVYSNIHK